MTNMRYGVVFSLVRSASMFNINKCTGASTLQVRCRMVFNTLKGDVVPCYKKYQREICSIQTGCTSELRWGMVWVPDAISTLPPTKLKTRVTAVVMLITPQKNTPHILIVGRIKTRVFFVVYFRQFLSVFWKRGKNTHQKNPTSWSDKVWASVSDFQQNWGRCH